MAKYIPLDALVAWAKETYLCENASMIRKVCYKQLLEHLDTLEVKEVDFEKELDRIWFDNKLGDYFDNNALDFAHIRTLCKHFFERGIAVSNKAQKGEK